MAWIRVRVVRAVRVIGLVKMVRVARVVCVALWANLLTWQSLTRCSGLATKGSYRTAWASKQIQVLIYHHIWYHLINIIIIKLWLKLTTLSSSVGFVHVVLTLQDSDCSRLYMWSLLSWQSTCTQQIGLTFKIQRVVCVVIVYIYIVQSF